MALHDFSAGYPRNGQWVLIEGGRLGIFVRDSESKTERRLAGKAKPPADAALAKLWTERQEARLAGDFERADNIRTKMLAAGANVPDDDIATAVVAVKKLVFSKELPSGKTKGTVDLVKDEDGSYDGRIEVELDKLTPLRDRNRIPKKRLDKMDPGFVPVP